MWTISQTGDIAILQKKKKGKQIVKKNKKKKKKNYAKKKQKGEKTTKQTCVIKKIYIAVKKMLLSCSFRHKKKKRKRNSSFNFFVPVSVSICCCFSFKCTTYSTVGETVCVFCELGILNGIKSHRKPKRWFESQYNEQQLLFEMWTNHDLRCVFRMLSFVTASVISVTYCNRDQVLQLFSLM